VTWWQRSSLRSKILVLTMALVLSAFGTGLIIMEYSTMGAVVDELGLRAMSVARTVAQVEAVRANLGRPDGALVIQPVVERMRLASRVEYIVAFDRNRIRYSHPLPELIGTRFEGGDEGPSLAQQAYVSRAKGVNGEAVRAFVPVLSADGSEQVGVVVVGIMVPTMATIIKEWAFHPVAGLVGGVLVSALGAWLLAANVKRQMFDLEPSEIARILEERVAVLSAVGEGLVAIAADGTVTVVNAEAQRIIGCGPEAVGRHVSAVLPHSELRRTVTTGKAEYDQQMMMGRTLVVVNRVPVTVRSRIVGAVATFRDRTEVHRLAEELTGVTRFVEGLRAQNHESLNKLHTIAGLIRMKEYQQALEYISTSTEQQQGVSQFLARHVKEYRVAGLLLGKVTRGRELGIDLLIDPQSRVAAIPPPLDGSDLVLILGNLIENAMEALAGRPGRRWVECLIVSDERSLFLSVADNGPGIPPDLRDAIFRRGFSTKGEHRGLGLALINDLVAFAGGRLTVDSDGEQTIFTVTAGEDDAIATDSSADRG
jgi:two-component system sensor histidine kinase DctS